MMQKIRLVLVGLSAIRTILETTATSIDNRSLRALIIVCVIFNIKLTASGRLFPSKNPSHLT